ncbi:uncharacterized protein LOC128951216 [Oppia nitens]|uniref:uncharacterized protein LOC128951216 n=1 Tax=Oppia nitens TaxID=1686743 RepID=UPI0023DCC250|nr:uncharacterized protein LOC128951216 [Oppia nitens]
MDTDITCHSMYAKDTDKDVFVCRHKDCHYETADENDVQIHCTRHTHRDNTDDNKTDALEVTTAENGNDLMTMRKTGRYVCEVPDCGKHFSYLKCFESHKRNEHSVNENNGTNSRDQLVKSDNSWELYVDCRETDGTNKLFCKWPDCLFGSNLRMVLKQHIINNHLTQKRIRCPPKTHNEYEYWDKLLFDKKGVRLSSEKQTTGKSPVQTNNGTKVATNKPNNTTPRQQKEIKKSVSSVKQQKRQQQSQSKTQMKSQLKIRSKLHLKTQLKAQPKSQIRPHLPKLAPNLQIINLNTTESVCPDSDSKLLEKRRISIDKNRSDVLLSCKGLASMASVTQYFNKRLINGEKIYWCKWGGCQFKTKKSQKIAEHINLSHIGVDFKCNKPNCNKVFKNPHSYREHQKNHICGFGSFGYGSKGVIGVCRNENLFKYRERIIVKGKKYYRCKCCHAITKYFTGMKRHIHSQHICPFRMNLHLTRHQTPMAIKQEIMDLDIDFDLFNNQQFICCLKCNEFFDSKEQLKQHQTLFCQFKDRTVSDIKIENSDDFNSNDQLSDNFDEFENTIYYCCQYDDDCKYVTPLKDKINDHILHHLNSGSTFGHSGESYDYLNPISIFEPQIKVEPIDYEDSDGFTGLTDNLDVKPSTSGLQSIQTNYTNIEKFIEIKCIDGDPNYFCVYNTLKCKYYTKEFVDIKNHIKESHVLFECDIKDCGKHFKNLIALNAHKVNHICGFGIKGRKSNGVCSLDNIKKYCDEKLFNNNIVYACKWTDCKFVSKTRNNVLSHSHHKHICPNRMLANNQKKPIINFRKTKAFNDRTSPPTALPLIDESHCESNSSLDSMGKTEPEVLGTFGTQESLDNFVKYSEEIMVDNKTVFVCHYPNCFVTVPRNRSYSPGILDKYTSYVTDFKHNMIRHIRRHCNDKPFVCGINGCEKRFSCSSQHKSHQSSHSLR